MDEFDLIRKYFAQEGEASGVSLGIGDDGAVLRPERGKDLVTVVDTLVQGVHFPENTDPFDIAYRVVAVNLSDIAAMGARPRWMTLAVTLPNVDDSWLAKFSAGLHAVAAHFDVALVGGDTTAGNAVVVTVQVIGDVAAGMAIPRSGAKPGDAIFLTGTVGDAAAGLETLTSGPADSFLATRFLRPDPRVEFGQSLSGIASAAIDVSDGLFADLDKMLTASGVGGVLDVDALPLSPELQAQFDETAQRRFALSGGDDYELCFTASSEADFSASTTPVSRIGAVVAGDSLDCWEDGQLVPFSDSGYRHFE